MEGNIRILKGFGVLCLHSNYIEISINKIIVFSPFVGTLRRCRQ